MNRHAIRCPNATVERHMGGVAPLRQHVRRCHADLDKGAAKWLQNPRSSRLRLYLHALCLEDVTMQSVLRDDRPLFASFWPHLVSPADAAALGQYARAVYASTDAYLVNLPSPGLNRVMDLDNLGLGRHTVGWVVRRFVVEELEHIYCDLTGGAVRPLSTTARGHDPLSARAVGVGGVGDIPDAPGARPRDANAERYRDTAWARHPGDCAALNLRGLL
jgi:hypothetical protein